MSIPYGNQSFSVAVSVHRFEPRKRVKIGDLSRERESSEQFVWYVETETQLRRWAIMPSIQAHWHQDEGI
jgi:hypothetical protein